MSMVYNYDKNAVETEWYLSMRLPVLFGVGMMYPATRIILLRLFDTSAWISVSSLVSARALYGVNETEASF
jgi:hypothetical protein